MGVILAADAVVVGNPTSVPLSLTLYEGEILGLLFLEGQPRTATLRALAGLDPPVSGAVRLRGAPRVALVGSGAARAEAFASGADVVIFDGLLDAKDRRAERDAWVRLASERERGTAILLATTSFEHAYRGDRVTLALWTAGDFTRELERLSRRMKSLVKSALDLVGTQVRGPSYASLSELKLLTRAARHLLGEARALAQTQDDRLRVEEAVAELARVSLDDRVLDSLIAKIEDS